MVLVVDADNVIADNGIARTFPVKLITSGSVAGHSEYAIDVRLPGDGLTRLDRPLFDKPKLLAALRSVIVPGVLRRKKKTVNK